MGCTPSKNPNQTVVDSQFRPQSKPEDRQNSGSQPTKQDKSHPTDATDFGQITSAEEATQRSNNQKPKRFRPKSAGIPFSEPTGLRLTYEKASQLVPKNPDEMWAIVNSTSEKVGIQIEPTKNRKGWRTIRLFVSSTFKDFHPEREVLVKEVCCFHMLSIHS